MVRPNKVLATHLTRHQQLFIASPSTLGLEIMRLKTVHKFTADVRGRLSGA